MVDTIVYWIFYGIGKLFMFLIKLPFRIISMIIEVRTYHREKDLTIPEASRFEHTHIVAGTGHGNAVVATIFVVGYRAS